jgi:hypothetical protein
LRNPVPFVAACAQVPVALAILLGAFASAQEVPRPPHPEHPTCRTPGLDSTSARDSDLLNAYNLEASATESVEASVMVRANAGDEYRARVDGARQSSPGVIRFHAPAMLRLIGVVPFSARRSYDMSSDGHDMRLLVPDGKMMRLFVGAADAPAVSSNARENLRPQPLIDALHWPHGTPSTIPSQEPAGKGPRSIALDLRGRQDARSASVDFDLERGVVSQLTLRDASGQPVTEVQYEDWEPVPGGLAPACLPRRIHILRNQQHLEVDMKILSISLNPPFQPSQFRMIPPLGIPVTRLAAPTAKDAPKGP